MSKIEPNSPLLEYDDKFYEIVYSDDHPDFIYTPSVPTGLHFISASTLSLGDSGAAPRRFI